MGWVPKEQMKRVQHQHRENLKRNPQPQVQLRLLPRQKLLKLRELQHRPLASELLAVKHLLVEEVIKQRVQDCCRGRPEIVEGLGFTESTIH